MSTEPLGQERRQALLSSDTSRINKIWLAIGWGVPWRWKGRELRSRIEVQLDGSWYQCDSFEEDVLPKMETRGVPVASSSR